MREAIRILGGLIGVLMFMGGCGFMWLSLSEDTIPEFAPLIYAVLGGSFLLAGILLYNNISTEDLKGQLRRSNDLMAQNAALLEKMNSTNIEIARRQHQAEKRQTGSLLNRERPNPPN